MSIQSKIVDIIIDKSQVDEQIMKVIANIDRASLIRKCFHNYRDSNQNDPRMTKFGITLLKRCCQLYQVNLGNEHTGTMKQLLYISRVSNLPYFIPIRQKVTDNEQIFITCDLELATMLQLVGGDIDSLIETKFRLDHATDYIIRYV
jgi:hypothetical protein